MAAVIQVLCRRLGKWSPNLHRTSCLTSHTSSRKASDESGGGQNQVSEKKFDLWEEYQKTKQATEALPEPADKDPKAIFANNELDLQDIEVYGFDYDYTLASYKGALHYLIYNLGKEALIQNHRYPREIDKFEYNPGFAVRGLHADVHKGLLLKIDAFHNIQLGTVYRGLRAIADDEVRELYQGSHVAIENISNFYGTGTSMHQLMDLFAVPEMTLFSNVIEYFVSNSIPYDPEYVFSDVKEAVQGLHKSGLLHNEIIRNIGVFIGKGSEVAELLKRLSAAGKKLFLITNSGVGFTDAGMRHMVGPNWPDLFDMVITNAKKPKFFYRTSKPFRSYDYELGIKSWDRVTHIRKGQFYQEGNLYQFQELTGWSGSRVLYFGDHVYSDLADVTLKHGWRTGAIIPELEDEIRIMNSQMYKGAVRWLTALQSLIERMQVHDDRESKKILKEWIKERNELRIITKNVFNPQFGSVFRTYHNPTYFSRRLNRFADIYTSSLTNLLNYPLDYTYYPRRTALPHELEFPRSLTDGSLANHS